MRGDNANRCTNPNVGTDEIATLRAEVARLRAEVEALKAAKSEMADLRWSLIL